MEDDQRGPLVVINNADVVNTDDEEMVLTASHGDGRMQSSESSFKAGAAESGSHKDEGAAVSSLFDRQMRHVPAVVHKHASLYCI